jgi:glucose-1-phosphate adenylyltransferase
MHDEKIIDLTRARAFGGVLFGGRYRLIYFPLSNLVNSGVGEVGIVTKSNYQSLLDHLSSGKEWDLARKNGGLHLLPPFANAGSGMYRGRLEALAGIRAFVDNSPAEYVIMTDCDIVTTLDYKPALEHHIATKADITCIYAKTHYDPKVNKGVTLFEIDGDRITNVQVDSPIAKEANMSLDMFILSKAFLKKIVAESISRNLYSFIRDILHAYVNDIKIVAYEHTGYLLKIESMISYYQANMALLDRDNMNALFQKQTPIYTKASDYGPTKYNFSAKVKNSLIADGCVIEGTVENSILFRGVKVGKGAVIKDCVLQQNTIVGNNSMLSAIISDKNVVVGENKTLAVGTENPLFLSKNSKI